MILHFLYLQFCWHQAVSSADIVVVMGNGCVKLVGSPEDLASSSKFSVRTSLSPLLSIQKFENSVDSCHESEVHSYEKKGCTQISGQPEETIGKDCTQISQEPEETIDAEERKEGKVELAVCRQDTVSVLMFSVLCLISPLK